MSGFESAIMPASRLGRGVWAQLKRRSAVRKALAQGALRVALRHGAAAPVADAFEEHTLRLIRQTGQRPVGVMARLTAVVRGGPATLFDGPEARLWKSRVIALGRTAYHEGKRSEVIREWLDSLRIDADEFGELYLREVQSYLAEQANDDAYSPELAILAEQARAEQEQQLIRRWTSTGITVAKVTLAVAAAGLIGHGVDIPNVPDWIETTAFATVAGAAATRRPRPEQSEEAVIVSGLAEALTHSQRRLRTRLRRVVLELVSLVDPSLRAPPSAVGHPLGTALSAALDLLYERARQKGVRAGLVRLTMSGDQREALARAGDALLAEARDLDLLETDPACMSAIEWLADAIETLTSSRSSEAARDLDLGYDLARLLMLLQAAAHVTDRIEPYPPVRTPPPPDEPSEATKSFPAQ